MAGQRGIIGRNRILAEKLLRDVVDSMRRCNIDYWLEGGTLLGLVRENRLLPWDDDIDLSMHATQVDALPCLLQDLKQKRYRVRIRRFEESTQYFQRGDVRLIKIRAWKLYGLIKSKLCLDIFIKYENEDKCYWMVNGLSKLVPAEYYHAFGTVEFKNSVYNIPLRCDEYLTYRYGDWRSPVKEWNTFCDDKALLSSSDGEKE